MTLRRKSIRSLQWLIAAGIVFFLQSAGFGAQNPGRPNILVILADDLSHGDLSCCGGSDVRTPQIDRIFREGRTLTRFRTNSSVCSPTRAALLTGAIPIASACRE